MCVCYTYIYVIYMLYIYSQSFNNLPKSHWINKSKTNILISVIFLSSSPTTFNLLIVHTWLLWRQYLRAISLTFCSGTTFLRPALQL